MSDDQSGETGLSRRDVLAGVAGVAVGGTTAAALADTAGANAQGQVGSSSNPLAGAYLAEIRGPITDLDAPIEQLVDHRVAEDSATIDPDPETLVFRYDPNTTV